MPMRERVETIIRNCAQFVEPDLKGQNVSLVTCMKGTIIISFSNVLFVMEVFTSKRNLGPGLQNLYKL